MAELVRYTLFPQVTREELAPWKDLLGRVERPQFLDGGVLSSLCCEEQCMRRVAQGMGRTAVRISDGSRLSFDVDRGRAEVKLWRGDEVIASSDVKGHVRFETHTNLPGFVSPDVIGGFNRSVAILVEDGARELRALSQAEREEVERHCPDPTRSNHVTTHELAKYGDAVRERIDMMREVTVRREEPPFDPRLEVKPEAPSPPPDPELEVKADSEAKGVLGGPVAFTRKEELESFVREKRAEADAEIINLIREERTIRPDGVSDQAWFVALLGCQERAKANPLPGRRLELFRHFVLEARQNPPALPKVRYGRAVR